MTTLRLLPDLETAIRQIPGIQAASVVTTPDATPTEVHVLAVIGKPAKQLVRDVQSLALARYDIDIDHRIVSIVQLPDDTKPARSGSDDDQRHRVAITAVMVRAAGSTAEAVVTLTVGNRRLEGRASGPVAMTHRARLIATATANAVQNLLRTSCEIAVAELHVIGGHELATTIIAITEEPAGEQFVAGSALIRGDESDAIARSVLSALNRRLTG
jgi:hypothetical protein